MAEFFGTAELANAVKAAMQVGGRPKESENIAGIPNARTIRYYLSEGMIPPPYGKKGVQLRFGKRHLLTILAIKKLQELGIASNAGIKQILEDKDDVELEKFLNEEVNVKTVADPEEILRFQQMSAAELEEEFGEPVQRVDLTESNPATEYFAQKLFPREEQGVSLKAAADLAPRSPRLGRGTPRRSSRNWLRHEIADGVELHIRTDADLSHERRSGELLARLRRILGL